MPDPRNLNPESEPQRDPQRSASRPEPPPTVSRPERSGGGAGSSETPPQPSVKAAPSPEKKGLKKTLLSLAAVAVLAVVLVPNVFRSNEATLPEPTTQTPPIEYVDATLKFKPAPTTPMPPDHSKWGTCAGGASSSTMKDLDLVIAIDTTGSMGGVLNDVKTRVGELISSLQAGGGSVRVGVVAYRDTGDSYVIKQYPLTDLAAGGAAGLTSFLGGLTPGGGGDWPEKVDAAVQTAQAMDWRDGVPGSIVVIGDAPAHPADSAAAMAAASSFRKGTMRQVSVIDTGSGAHPFMQALPSAGGGQYVTYGGNILNSLLPAITACPIK